MTSDILLAQGEGEDATGWMRTSSRLRASLLASQLAEEAEGSHEGSPETKAQQQHDRHAEQPEDAGEAASKDSPHRASANGGKSPDREQQEPAMVQNGFVTRLSLNSSGSDSRSFPGQSSMQSIPEGKLPWNLYCRLSLFKSCALKLEMTEGISKCLWSHMHYMWHMQIHEAADIMGSAWDPKASLVAMSCGAQAPLNLSDQLSVS